VLDISGGKTDNGTKIQLWEKNGRWNQIWEINRDGTISNPQSGKVLDISEDKIHLWEKHGGWNQRWAERNGWIINPQSGKALDVNPAGTGPEWMQKFARFNYLTPVGMLKRIHGTHPNFMVCAKILFDAGDTIIDETIDDPMYKKLYN
jgi:hypothetical protein